MAEKYNFAFDAGTDVEQVFSVNTSLIANLTGWTAISKLRRHHTSANSVSFTATINASASSVTLSLNNSSSANLWGRYVYDVILTDNTEKIRLVDGLITVYPSVSHS